MTQSASSDEHSPLRRLRVLCYIGSLAAGGAERQVVEILRHLDRSRFEPTLLLAHQQGPLLAEVPDDVCVLSATPESSSRLPGMTRWLRWRRFSRILHERQIDVVYDRTYLATLDAAVACWLRKTPRVSAAVADPHVQFEMYARRPRWLWRRLSRWAYRSAQVVLANSEGLRQQLLNYWGLEPDQVVVQPNAFDFARIDQLATGESVPKPPGHDVILTVGRIDRDKGHRDLLEALRRLICEQGHHELCWRVIGHGPDEDGLRAAVQAAGLAAHVEFLGVLANPYPEYRAADLFCLPSRTEGLPNVLIEALACGTPVVATDCPSGPREILRDGTFGLLAQVSHPEHLSQMIAEALRDRVKWREAALAGRLAMQAQYAAEPVVRKLEVMLIQTVSGWTRSRGD